MAGVDIIELGYATQDTATVVVRSLTAGAVSVVGAGQHEAVSVDPDVSDGLGVVRVTGLSADQRYPVDVYVGSSLIGSAVLQTMPTDTPFGVVVSTCHGATRGWLLADWLLERSPRIVHWHKAGDYPYTETNAWSANGKEFGETLDTLSSIVAASGTDDQIKSNLRAHYRHVRMLPGHREMRLQVPSTIDDGDDHALPGDNAYGTIPDTPDAADWDEILNASGTPGNGGANKDGANLTTDVTAYRRIIDLCYAVQREWAIGNPPNPSANSDTRFANSMWYAHKINEHLEMFVISCISVRDLKNRSPRSIFGTSPQMVWLKAALKNSTATFKLICSPKPFWRYLDGWESYTDDRDELETYIDDAVNGGNPDGWLVPGGVFMACGDMHYAEVFWSGKLLSVNCGPATQTFHVLADGYSNNSVWRMTGYRANTANKLTGLRGAVNTSLVVDVYDDYAELSLRGPSGEIRWRNRVLAGTNEPVGDDVSIGA